MELLLRQPQNPFLRLKECLGGGSSVGFLKKLLVAESSTSFVSIHPGKVLCTSKVTLGFQTLKKCMSNLVIIICGARPVLTPHCFQRKREFVSIPQMTEARGRGRVNDLLSVAQFGCTPSPV